MHYCVRLLDAVKALKQRAWYARQTIEHGWSRNILTLQKRGLFRTEYTGTTLRDHFGLPRPVSRYAKRAPEVASA
ncbi:hypothetical protein E4K65_42655 [Bradyrhizobium niftali]|uniref:YhcG N-terminal domain-containing protein n=1 Tax=Bradyrhizobium niftali TaxID=2560055 RepID=A0A4Y9L6N4_9BRAD|nr:hypothetical protein E4K65_42655 [Bradyrhizobium niftali]